MIRNTHARNPQRRALGVSRQRGGDRRHAGHALLSRSARPASIARVDEPIDILMKVETHNHPTAISPFPGAATGSGGEIRDEGATGRGAKPKAGLTGFSVSHLRIPGLRAALGDARLRQARAHRLGARHHDRGPDRRRRVQQRIRPARHLRLLPHLRAAPRRRCARPHARLSQAHHDRRRPRQRAPRARREERGPGRRASSSCSAGRRCSSAWAAARPRRWAAALERADLDFASVQRGNAGDPAPRAGSHRSLLGAGRRESRSLLIHDVGAGGLSNAVPEAVAHSHRGARIDLRAMPSAEPGMSPLEIWCNEAQERYVLAIAAERPRSVSRRSRERERCPFAVIGEIDGTTACWSCDDALFGNAPGRHADRRAARQAAAHAARRAQRARTARRRSSCGGIDLREAAYRVLRFPAVADKTFLITIGDRTRRRPDQPRPDGRPLAGAGERCRRDARRLSAMRARRWRWASARRWRVLDAPASGAARGRRGAHQHSRRRHRLAVRVRLSANWMAACGEPGEDAALYATGARGGRGALPGARHRDSRRQGLAVHEDQRGARARAGEDRRRAGVADRVGVRAGRGRAQDADAAAAHRPRRDRAAGSSIWAAAAIGSAAPASRRCTASSATSRRISTTRSGSMHFAAALARAARSEDLVLAYHDRSDGGLFATLVEMAFAGHCGLDVALPAGAAARRWRSCSPRSWARCMQVRAARCGTRRRPVFAQARTRRARRARIGSRTRGAARAHRCGRRAARSMNRWDDLRARLVRDFLAHARAAR